MARRTPSSWSGDSAGGGGGGVSVWAGGDDSRGNRHSAVSNGTMGAATLDNNADSQALEVCDGTFRGTSDELSEATVALFCSLLSISISVSIPIPIFVSFVSSVKSMTSFFVVEWSVFSALVVAFFRVSVFRLVSSSEFRVYHSLQARTTRDGNAVGLYS